MVYKSDPGLRDIAGKIEESIEAEDWGEVKSALNDLWDLLDHRPMERDKVARMNAKERGEWLDRQNKTKETTA